jgi:cell division transport system permease protein
MAKVTNSIFETVRSHVSLVTATLVTLTFTYSLITFMYLVSVNFEKILTLWGETMQMAIYLEEDAKEEVVQGVRNKLESEVAIGAIEFISSKDATANFREQMKSYAPDLARDKELEKFMPSSFQISLASNIPIENHLQHLQDLAKKAGKWVGVEDVSYGQEWVKNFTSVISAFKSVGVFFILVFLLSSLFVTSTAIKSFVNRRRDEISVLELVGASAWAIRKPFIIEGMVFGLVSSILGIALTYLGHHLLVDYINDHLGFLQLTQSVTFLSIDEALILVSTGAFFGGISAFLCIRRLNSGWLAAGR